MPLLIRLLLPAGLAMQHRRPFIPKSLRTPKQELPAQSQHNNRLLDSMSSRTQRYHKIKGNGSVPWGESSLLGSCAGVYCSLGTRCAVVDGTPKCVCSTSCPLRDGPKTCGSDDVLYANECYMKALACRLGRRHLSVVRYGRCRERVQSREFECRRFFVVMETATFFSFSGPCDRLKCVDVCVENRNGATCLCTATCLPGGRRVCGTNGVTYANECTLKLASCRAGVGRSIEVERMGPCPPKPNGI